MHFKDFSHRVFWGRGITKTFWRAMKLTGILMLIALLHVSAAGLAQKVTLFLKDAPLQKVFDQIKQQTGLSFLWDEQDLTHTSSVTLNVKDAAVSDVLDECLKNQGLSYTMVKNMVVIKKLTVGLHPAASSSFLSPPLSEIHGRVTDSLGNPLAGASVSVKGGNMGTMTDENGNFILTGVSEKAVLIVSYTGYSTRNIRVNGTHQLTVKLLHANDLLDQVQIIAYGTTTRRLSTGDVSTVTREEIGKQPVANPLFALEGRVPGLVINQGSGNPGSGYSVEIRGLGSISSSNQPLYIIDGIPYSASITRTLSINGGVTANADILNPLNFINPLDIESISILKDADATAIYGSRGANGIILITTKRGKSGDTKVEINAYTGTGNVAHYMDLLNTQQYVAMRREAFANDGLVPDANSAYDLFTWDTTKYTNWQKKLIGGTSNVGNAQITISGGGKNTQFLVSSDYHRQTTVYPGDFSDQRGSVNFSLNNISENQKLKTTLSANYMVDNSNLPNSDLTFNLTGLAPNMPDFVDSKGNLVYPPFIYFNPFAFLKQKYLQNSYNLIANASIQYQILPNLAIRSPFGFNRTDINETATNPVAAQNPAFGVKTGSSQFNTASNQSWIAEPQIEWNSNIGPGKLDILVGSSFQEFTQQGLLLNATGYTNDALLKDLGSAGNIAVGNSSYTKYRYNAFFGRINYDWDNKYILNITGRRDGSSRFGPDKQFSNFGAVGAAWLFSNEPVLKNNVSFLSFGKLRGSYGITGNDGIPDYGYLSLWKPTQYPFQGSPSLYPTNLANADYAWERNRKLELAIELGFIKDRILFSASWYQNRSDNQLVGYPLPPSSGFATIQANLPAEVQNTGVEITLHTINVKTNSFFWSSSFNISIPRNLLLAYPNISNSGYANIYTVGKPLYATKNLHYIGVDSKTGVDQFQDLNGNGSGVDIPADLESTKALTVNFYGGFQNTINYKGFQLDFLFQFVRQTGLDPFKSNYVTAPGTVSNQSVEVLNRWKEPGDIAPTQRFTTGGGSGFPAYLAFLYGTYYGDNRITDASFIRLKNLSLSYNLPDKLLKNIKIQQFRIYLQGQNLFTITSYKGLDPENNSVFGHLPPLRVLTLGFQLTF